MRLEIINTTKYRIPRKRMQKVLNKACLMLRFDIDNGEISVAIVGRRRMQNINKIYRGLDKPTDVLSFDYGEILLCPDYIKEKYNLNKKSVIDKMVELFAHGLVHIAGFDHKNDKNELKMIKVEQKILT